MSVQQGQSHEVTLPSAIPRFFFLSWMSLGSPCTDQFCCNVAVGTGSCTPCELELVEVPTRGRQYSQQEWFHTPQPHGTGSLCPLKMHCVTPGCACLSSPCILDVENRTNFILNKSHQRFSVSLSSYTEPLVFSIFFFLGIFSQHSIRVIVQ